METILSTEEFFYENLAGQVVNKRIRKEFKEKEKEFTQKFLIDGEWKGHNEKKEVLQPYKFSTIKNEQLIVLVEGEKCADRLLDENIAATTTGASN